MFICILGTLCQYYMSFGIILFVYTWKHLSLSGPAFRTGRGHKDHSNFMVNAASKHLPVTSTAPNAENFSLPTPAGLSHRMDTDSGIHCPHCPLVLLDGADYRNHISRQHGFLLQFTCSLCGKGYQTSMGLHYHMQGHQGKNYSCPMCNVKLTRMFSLKMHLKKVHRSAKCQTCQRFLSLGEEFNNHVLHCGSAI
ncbi:unnamed protein product [Candidula unifasciata]|uniref:C2H2-type domain-containing protein n=1 Tax=Candidula unifasciata TaxID=100452 RepID=A0A8S3ZDL4_9EUPU|nr:unnamed protein product [Candidula unifasciata]